MSDRCLHRKYISQSQNLRCNVKATYLFISMRNTFYTFSEILLLRVSIILCFKERIHLVNFLASSSFFFGIKFLRLCLPVFIYIFMYKCTRYSQFSKLASGWLQYLNIGIDTNINSFASTQRHSIRVRKNKSRHLLK